ncbi:MAG: GntR family transcriptional regulator [Burkholderiales bacterium]|nr:GntR family transcriptional regulator [Burkholderiales bacterium]MDE1929340.1 GntR family transcriptional regulator [Burkholderiales bacterium]MDE2159101.1 GntR family transcriptional regulator [Burkholderiales bacterium]MDE2504831.1 GntR family transcriptional regulator [Burkholderiales bacterium]
MPVHPAIAPEAAGMPLFRAVKRALLQRIEAGEIAPGQALPSEAALAATYGVSIGTLRRAVDDLVAEHILVRRQGRGTYVATHGSDRFLFQFFHVERADGLREVPQVELVSFERARLDDDAAAALDLKIGTPALQVENRLLLQGRAVVYDRIVIPAALFRGLTEKRWQERPGTIYQLYQSGYGITVARAHERLAAVGADRATARVLGIAPSQPLLQVRRVAIDLGGHPVEWRISMVLTAQHEYVNRLSRPA